jgi:two-component system, chemotaxis family, chemotaxis protein CheY
MSSLASADKSKPVLIVDDFKTMRRIVRQSLRAMGFESMDEAEDGRIALQKLQQGNFQLIISDWNMPNMMGIDLLKAVRADTRLKTIPFLMLTAESQKENVLEAARAGVSNYIVKPFTQDQLEAKLEQIYVKLAPK